MAPETQLKGLEWVQGTFSLEPRWTIEPDLESVRQTVEQELQGQKIIISFLAQGAYNKLYNIQAGDETFVMRVALPVDPKYKTLSEVATMDWIRQHTSLPVPKVFTHQATREDLLGFEWILMEKMPGKPLADAWRHMEYSMKEQLVQQLAVYSATLFRNQLRGIGNIYPSPSSENASEVKRIVSMQFFWGDHLWQDVPRGPFRSTKDWMLSRLALTESDCKATIAKYEKKDNLTGDDEDDDNEAEDAERTLQIIKRLRIHVDRFFPKSSSEPELSMLFHDDISRHNILVDDNGFLTGVLDWECVSALPLWRACFFPYFLEGPPRETKPEQIEYDHEYDGEVNELYWEHLMEHELTELRRYFLHEMGRLEPGWVQVFDASATKRDFETAVHHCDEVFVTKSINAWLDDVDSGKEAVRSLQDMIDDPWGALE